MYQRILIPLDGSTRAEMILSAVEELARRFESTLILTTVVEPMPIMSSPQQLVQMDIENVQEREKAAHQYLSTKANELRAIGLTVETFVLSGGVIESLLQLAQAENATLIAVTSHGRGGLASLLLGSVALGLLNQSQLPMLIVRNN